MYDNLVTSQYISHREERSEEAFSQGQKVDFDMRLLLPPCGVIAMTLRTFYEYIIIY